MSKQPQDNTPDDELDQTRDLNELQSDFISQPSDALFGAPSAQPPGQVGDLLQLGPYAIIGSPELGSATGKREKYIDGGEGRVYLAHHQADGAKVVLKTPLPQLARDPVRCARLIREAEQLRSMNHPAIVKVLDINADSDPPYYTMRYLAGGSLSSRMKKGEPMPKQEVLRIAIPLADALRYVNDELGISHRDIKPGNVMLDERGEPCFIDFGLSRDNTGDEKSITTHRNNTNRFKVGTARYMAPELFDGKAGNAQTDIYAFGIMLYELATGGRPYEAPDYPTIDKMKRLVDPPTPAQAYPEIDPHLAAIIEHALARRPKDRYATMEDLLEDLELIKFGSPPIHAVPIAAEGHAADADSTHAPAQAAKRSSLKLAFAAMMLLGAIGGGIGYAVYRGDIEGSQALAKTDDNTPKDEQDSGGSNAAKQDGTKPEEGGVTQDDNNNNSQNNQGQQDQESGGDGQGESDQNPLNNQGDHSNNGQGEHDSQSQDGLSDGQNNQGTSESGGSEQNRQGNEQDGQGHRDEPKQPEPPVFDVAQVVGSISGEIRAADADQRDAAVAELVLKLSEAEPKSPDGALRETYGRWLHGAAAKGMPQTLAALIKKAEAFGASAGALDDNGHTWLQTAVSSAENQAFANAFPQWMKDNAIDPAILTTARIGTRSPAENAAFLGRAAWTKALKELGVEHNFPE